MNDRNANLFFNNNGEEVAVITLNDEEGNEVEAAVMAVFQLEEQYPDYEFAVLMPMVHEKQICIVVIVDRASQLSIGGIYRNSAKTYRQ